MEEVDKLISVLASYISQEIEEKTIDLDMADNVKALAELVSARAQTF